ncbi:MAG: sigma-70 family RNA polymerase sigma factor [Bacteroidetes bacterium]|nr:sigma-70 family RNA polymerase sigma factor [Bacteroidota bacterium]
MKDLHDIIEGCKRNDRSSQEKLYRQFYPGLFALCKKFFHDNHDALTSLNNGMLNVFKNIGKYDPAKGELFNWAYTIVRNAAITHLNNMKIVQQTTEITGEMEQSLFSSPFKELEWNDLFSYLDKLPPATRAVCSLHYIEGFAVREISEQLSLSEGTIKWHLSESRSRLKTLFFKTSIH